MHRLLKLRQLKKRHLAVTAKKLGVSSSTVIVLLSEKLVGLSVIAMDAQIPRKMKSVNRPLSQ